MKNIFISMVVIICCASSVFADNYKRNEGLWTAVGIMDIISNSINILRPTPIINSPVVVTPTPVVNLTPIVVESSPIIQQTPIVVESSPIIQQTPIVIQPVPINPTIYYRSYDHRLIYDKGPIYYTPRYNKSPIYHHGGPKHRGKFH